MCGVACSITITINKNIFSDYQVNNVSPVLQPLTEHDAGYLISMLPISNVVKGSGIECQAKGSLSAPPSQSSCWCFITQELKLYLT